MDHPFVRWWVVFCTMVCVITLAMMSGGAGYIWENDSTFISWFVLGVFTVGSLHLGYMAREKSSDFEATEYFSQLCGGLGMLGTIVGLMISMIGAFKGIDAADPESIKTALTSVATGVGAALTTTLVGLSCALMLDGQLTAVRAKWRA
ncbi:MotA/TolQ/ExbB proton channel family protein [Candidatus Pacearchaeota archaeon]|nr:MotA/TolQ/ExbB proton channel family protein [Candidatus Pacearchaeota archaeon]